MSDGSDDSPKLDTSAAVMVQRALKDQSLAERINAARQSAEVIAICEQMINSKEWISQAEGIYVKMEDAARIAKIGELLRRMALAYKIGFEAGRTYEREYEEKPKLEIVTH